MPPSPDPRTCELPEYPSLRQALSHVSVTVHTLLKSPDKTLYQPDASAWHDPGPPCRASLAGLFAARHFGFTPDIKLRPAQFPNRTETFLNSLDLLHQQETALACKLLHVAVYHKDLCDGDIGHYWSERYIRAQIRLIPTLAEYEGYTSFQELRGLIATFSTLNNLLRPGRGRQTPSRKRAAA